MDATADGITRPRTTPDRARRGSARGGATTAMKRPLPSPATSDRTYSDEEFAVLKHCEAYRVLHKKPFLTTSEVFYVVKSMGYRRHEGA